MKEQQPQFTEELKHIVTPLLTWYQKEKRDLPWRKNVTPYRVWVSEIMLQQTRVEAVKPYYKRFLEALPTVNALAQVEEQELLKLWEGLGYYNRVRNMQKAAKVIVSDFKGEFPSSYETLLTLPGIGAYTAGAISSIAFHEPVCAVDGNVLRVISRVLGLYDDIAKPQTTVKFTKLLLKIIPAESPGDFNQSLMELGATVCLPVGIAKCEQCPLASQCKALKTDTIVELPVKTPKKPRRLEDKTVFLIVDENGNIALNKRSDKGLLANLWEFPNCEGYLKEKEVTSYLEAQGLVVSALHKSKKAKHIFTHIEWHMLGYFVRVSHTMNTPFTFVSFDDFQKRYPLPNAFKAFKEELVSHFWEPSPTQLSFLSE